MSSDGDEEMEVKDSGAHDVKDAWVREVRRYNAEVMELSRVLQRWNC
jgi:hypothetical protein